MSRRLVVDTHVVIWYFLEPNLLSATASKAMSEADTASGTIFVSAITLVELRYLIEKGRIAADAFDALSDALDDPATSFELVKVDRAVANALAQIPRNIVPDMPDRIIAATAHHLGLPLVTRDLKIRTSGVTTIW